MGDPRNNAVLALDAILDVWTDRDWSDLDGETLQDILIKHGVFVAVPATQDEFDDPEWRGHEYDMQPGDNTYVRSKAFSDAAEQAKS